MSEHSHEDSTPSALRQRKAPDEIRIALKAHLQRILEGDLTPRMLLELEQAAGLAHKLLIVSGEPRAFRNGGRGGYGIYPGGMPNVMDVVGPDDLYGMPGGPGGPTDVGVYPLAPAALGSSENFGAETIRNVIANFNQPKLMDTLRSLEIAEDLLKDHPTEPQYIKTVARLRAQVAEQSGTDEPEGELDAVFENSEGGLS